VNGSNDIPTLKAFEVNDSLLSRVKILRNLLWSAKAGLQNPQILAIARQVTRACAGRDANCELRSIYKFVVENVRYTGDVNSVDTFSAPLRTLQMGGEDCDGHAVLNAALAIANGFKAKVRITSNRGISWDHIYCMVGLPKGRSDKWIPLDTTLARSRADVSRYGIEPPRAKFQDFSMEKP
jgi:transglutaminase-like putative cysteine protease